MSPLDLLAIWMFSCMGLHLNDSVYWTCRAISDKAFPGKLTMHHAEDTETLGIPPLDPAG